MAGSKKAELGEDDPKAGTWFRVLGGQEFFPEDSVVNGYYVQQPTLRPDGYPWFIRLSKTLDEDPMCIWWLPKRKLWMINLRSQIDTETARAVAKSPGSLHPLDVKSEWLEFNGDTRSFVPGKTLIFREALPEEVDEESIQRVRFSGRKGYNRFMNGIYLRGPKTHNGRPYYEHQDPALHFKIRWFQTKWVVDWREGLHEDNIGCAVCKADAPEPWMCPVPWRIYDAKKKDNKKWGDKSPWGSIAFEYDEDVQLVALPNDWVAPNMTQQSRIPQNN